MANIFIRSGNVITFRGTRWWAEGGLICSEDVNTGHYQTHKIRDILIRLNAIKDMVGNSIRDKSIASHADELRSYQDYVENMITLVQEAKRQGDPTDPRVVKEKMDQIKIKRQNKLLFGGLSF